MLKSPPNLIYNHTMESDSLGYIDPKNPREIIKDQVDYVQGLRSWTGENLEIAIQSTLRERPPIIEDFLYDKSALLLYADDGIGKSILSLQTAMQATVEDSFLFNEFRVANPSGIVYFQMERHPHESFERIKHMCSTIPFDKSKFTLSVELQCLDLMDKHMFIEAEHRVDKVINALDYTPKILFFDPIYTMVSSDLSRSEAANLITMFFRKLQLVYGCTIFATSHTNRGVRDSVTYRRVAKDLYGNRFLSAFFTGSYHLESINEGAGCKFTLDKNSQDNLEKNFSLFYDASNHCSYISEQRNITKKQRLINFLKSCKLADKTFTFEEMLENSKVSRSKLREIISGQLKNELEIVCKSKMGKHLYKYTGH